MTADTGNSRALRSAILHCPAKATPDDPCIEYIADGVLWIDNGLIKACGPAAQIVPMLPGSVAVEHYPGKLLMPGFLDLHVHYPQFEMMAAYGDQLLDWLNRYTFPTEMRYTDYAYARRQAEGFLDQLIANGTTTALVFATSSVSSVEAFFEAAFARNLRMLSGKVLMDRHAPEPLCDTAESAYADSEALIKRWQAKGRLGYAITPRFAPTSSEAQLEAAGALRKAYPDTYVHTHLAENRNEVAWVAELFPERRSYLDVYDHFGLMDSRSIFAHGIYLNDSDLKRLSQCRATLCHCPSSNLFLGSGLFPLKRALNAGIQVALGTDVGAGTSLSMLRTLGDAYKVQQLLGEQLAPSLGLYLLTLGAARSLGVDRKIGNFEPGKEADLVLIDPLATDELAARVEYNTGPESLLFALSILGDNRCINRVWVMGEPVHPATPSDCPAQL